MARQNILFQYVIIAPNNMDKWEAKDKRISFLSIFSSLCGLIDDKLLIKDNKLEIEKIEKEAYKMTEDLWEKYHEFESSPEMKKPIETKEKIIKKALKKPF